MTDRDRLMEKIEYLQKVFMEDDDYDYLSEFLADRLLADKDIIIPPCKVGQIVYVIYPDPRYNWGNKKLKMLELKVYAFHCFDNKVNVEIRGDGNYITWDINCFGVCVFLTKEEAEAKLKEMKNNA